LILLLAMPPISSSKFAVGLGLILLLSLAAWCVVSLKRKNTPDVLASLARTVRWQGPWYYRVAEQTHAAKLIPTGMLDTHRLALEVSLKRFNAVAALTRLGTNARPVAPTLVAAVLHKDSSIGICAAEALAGIHAEECPEWATLRKELSGQAQAARAFRWLVVGRAFSGRSYDLAHRRFGLLGLAATGPAARAACSDIVEILKNDREPELRACAAMALGSIEAERPAVLALLKSVVQDQAEWPVVSAAAAHALANAAPAETETRALLHQALQDPRSAVRLAAARALWELKAPAAEVLPVLTALLGHKLASTRAGALQGLSEMGSAARSSASEVQRLTLDENESVRRAAAEALKRIRLPLPHQTCKPTASPWRSLADAAAGPLPAAGFLPHNLPTLCALCALCGKTPEARREVPAIHHEARPTRCAPAPPRIRQGVIPVAPRLHPRGAPMGSGPHGSLTGSPPSPRQHHNVTSR
jgi:HEAT repeat protein